MSPERIVVKRDPFASFGLWWQAVFAVAAFVIFALPEFLRWEALTRWQLMIPAAVTLCVGVVLFRLWFRLTRRIVLLDDYIAFKSTFGTSRAYPYSAIVDMRAIKRLRSRWKESTAFEEAVSVMFADGRILAIPAGNMQIEGIKAFIENKTGRKFDPVFEA